MNITRAARRGKLRLIIPGMAVAIAGLLISFSPIASAHTDARTDARTDGRTDGRTDVRTVPAGGLKPTIVLEHGAWGRQRQLGCRHGTAASRWLHRRRPAQPAAGPAV